MQKIRFIPPAVFEILKFKNPAIWLVERIFALNLRTRFFPDMLIKIIMVHDLNPKNLRINGLICFLQNPENLFLECFWALFPKWDFSQKFCSVSFLLLGYPNFMRSFRKILWAVLEKTRLPTDILTVVKS